MDGMKTTPACDSGLAQVRTTTGLESISFTSGGSLRRNQRGEPVPKTVPSFENAPAPLAPYSVATEANGLVFFSGQVAIDPSGGETPGGIAAQTRLIMDNIGRLLGELGLGYDDLVKTTIFLKDIADFSAMNEEYGSYFGSRPPARTTVQAGALPAPQFLVEIESIASR
jgi:2-iminobutanoate/2-iminopropanoate deaminase